jgi:hypothetical protein
VRKKKERESGVVRSAGMGYGRLCAPQMKRVPSSKMKARPNVSSRL